VMPCSAPCCNPPDSVKQVVVGRIQSVSKRRSTHLGSHTADDDDRLVSGGGGDDSGR
jgi:hypothetical protein